VSILEPTDAAGLSALLSEASVFVCMSDHPDLSVPLTEAQARGVPIIAAEGAAIRDRLGPGQLVVDQPKTAADYAVLAELVRAVRTDRALRRQLITAGQRNVLRRFTPETIGDRLLGWLFPVLERLAA
jgi:glycosyltransferase involved in cell wall biosynthesis